MAVAIARAVAARTGANEPAVMRPWPRRKRSSTARPPGIDAAAASRGRVGRYDKASGWRDLPLAAPIELCVGLSGKSHDTGALVASVRALCASTPVARRLVEAMGELASAGIDALAAGDLATLAHLFNLAHGLLAGVGVYPRARRHGAHRPAGRRRGRQADRRRRRRRVIALAGEPGEEILRRWRGKGYYGFLTTIGHG